jgi:hypothetical protein
MIKIWKGGGERKKIIKSAELEGDVGSKKEILRLDKEVWNE